MRPQSVTSRKPAWHALAALVHQAVIVALVSSTVGLTLAAMRPLAPQIFPTVRALTAAIGDGVVSGTLTSALGLTLARAFLGVVFAGGAAIAIGAVYHVIPGGQRGVDIGLDYWRALPASALYPVFMWLFGFDNTGKTAIVAFTVTPVLSVVVIRAVGQEMRNSSRSLAVRTWGLGAFGRLRYWILPAIVTAIGTAAELAVSMALLVVVVAEMFFGAQDGIGGVIYNAYLGYRLGVMWAAILALGAASLLANALLRRVRSALNTW